MADQLISSAQAQRNAAEVKKVVDQAAVESKQLSIDIQRSAEARVDQILAERRQAKRQGKSWLARLFG